MEMEQFNKCFEYFVFSERDQDPNWIRPEGIYITAYKGTDADVIVPEKAGDNAIVRINSFGECPSIKSVVIPPNIEFSEDAFDGCPGLADGDGNLVIDGKLLRVDTQAAIVRVPEGVTEICSNLVKTSYSRPNNAIEELILPEGLLRIGGSAFAECEKLKCVHLPESLLEIGYNAFEGCESLENITFPKGLKKIESYAFTDCKKLKGITVPPETECEEGVFEGCSTENDGLLVVNGVLQNADCRSNSSSIELSAEVTSIDPFAFFDPPFILEQVTLTDNIQEISEDAFSVLGIGVFRLVNHTNNKVIFETEEFANCEPGLNYSEDFSEMCEMICNKEYDELAEFGTIYKENIE